MIAPHWPAPCGRQQVRTTSSLRPAACRLAKKTMSKSRSRLSDHFAGQITGIFGLVGSGRTETAKIVAGAAKRDLFHGGDIRFDGRSVRYRTPRQAVGDGVV